MPMDSPGLPPAWTRAPQVFTPMTAHQRAWLQRGLLHPRAHGGNSRRSYSQTCHPWGLQLSVHSHWGIAPALSASVVLPPCFLPCGSPNQSFKIHSFNLTGLTPPQVRHLLDWCTVHLWNFNVLQITTFQYWLLSLEYPCHPTERITSETFYILYY
jgi:hypothetical protein